ncbi:MAG: insulinase family protein [Eggerthellaceae bacterium]|nr:insulinase family protein [Eggerthellaceae bacterium]
MKNLNSSYRLINSSKVQEIYGTAYDIIHKKSQAKILFLKNDDIDKCFSITFKTPPSNNTGVFHILEHSVLNGSKKFPVKEPFVQLLKTSMNTFLNAMTFPDKTMFPVSSTNDKDLHNLVDVYMDAVLNPLIYENPDIFKQEGWHYEIKDGKAQYSGVVYNEMRGIFSDPEAHLYYEGAKRLYLGSCYSYDSGGYPNAIPELSYEKFLKNHAKHYRLDNSYIVLYGNIDIESMLDFLDKEYLSKEPERLNHIEEVIGCTLKNEIYVESYKVTRPVFTTTEQLFPEDMQSNALLYSVENNNDFVKSTAVQTLTDVLTGSNEAPLKRELLKYKLAEDISFQYIESMKDPLLFCYFKSTKDLKSEKTYKLIREICQILTEEGLDKKLITASLNRLEFKLREMDFSYPDGLVYTMNSLRGWLYGENESLSFIRFDSCISKLKELRKGNYFDKLCEEIFIKNTSIAGVALKPVASKVQNSKSLEKLKSFDLDSIEKQNETLVAYTNKIDSPQELSTLPQLKISNLKEPKKNEDFQVIKKEKYTLLDHEMKTNGILYCFLYFDLQHVSFEDTCFLALIKKLLGCLRTKKHSTTEIDQMKNEILGDLDFCLQTNCSIDDPGQTEFKLKVKFSMLEEKLSDAVDLVSEITFDTVFEEKEKILNIIKQLRQNFKQSIINAGQLHSSLIAKSQIVPCALLEQKFAGYPFYEFLSNLIVELEGNKNVWNNLLSKLGSLYAQVLRHENLHISCAGKRDLRTLLEYEITNKFVNRCICSSKNQLKIPNPIRENTAIAIPGNVNYNAASINLKQVNEELNFGFDVVGNAISLDYLWNAIRVKGGAYGAFFNISNTGTITFCTYRDPKIKESFENFTNCCDYLQYYTPSEEELEGYIISQVSKIDNPKKPKTIIEHKNMLYFIGAGSDFDSVKREAAINCSIDDFRKLGKILAAHISDFTLACVGNETQIKSEAPNFNLKKVSNIKPFIR